MCVCVVLGALPLLIVYGTNDALISGEKVLQEDGIKAFKDKTVAVIPGAGHIVFYDAQDATVRAILGFTRKVLGH